MAEKKGFLRHFATPPLLFSPASHHPDHDVGEGGDPQGGGSEGQHEAVVPARCGAVGDGEVEQQAQRPSQQPLQLVEHARCKHTAGHRVSTEMLHHVL